MYDTEAITATGPDLYEDLVERAREASARAADDLDYGDDPDERPSQYGRGVTGFWTSLGFAPLADYCDDDQ